MKKIEILWIVILIAFMVWLAEGNIFSILSAIGEVALKIILCAVFFFVICLFFPKSWFAKIFKNKL